MKACRFNRTKEAEIFRPLSPFLQLLYDGLEIFV